MGSFCALASGLLVSEFRPITFSVCCSCDKASRKLNLYSVHTMIPTDPAINTNAPLPNARPLQSIIHWFLSPLDS
jgi:hypothetical protein